MDPLILSESYDQIPQLADKKYLDARSIDIWLLNLWRTMLSPHIRFLPTSFLPPTCTIPPDDSEIDFFRSFYTLPPRDTPCPLENVVHVLNTGSNANAAPNHFCTLVFMPSDRIVYVLGRQHAQNGHRDNDKDWDTWNGRNICARICSLFGWGRIHSQFNRICSVNWIQNGYDCGPIACQVVQHIMQHGMLIVNGRWKRPTFPCCHPLRKMIAEKTNEMVADGCRKFRALSDAQLVAKSGGNIHVIDTWAEYIDSMTRAAQLDPAIHVKAVARTLNPAMQKCRFCQGMVEERRRKQSTIQFSTSIEKKMKEATRVRRKEVLKGAVSVAQYVLTEEAAEQTDPKGAEFRKDSEDTSAKNAIARHNPGRGGQGAFVVDWTEARIGRFSRPKKGPELPVVPSLQKRQHDFISDFDEYYNGPTLEVLDPIPDTIMHHDASLVYLANRIMTNPWTQFSDDLGYRLLPTFFQNFHLGDPILFEQHMCPVGLKDVPKSITDYHPKASGREGETVRVTDEVCMGAGELLNQADREGEDMVLLTGKTQEKKYVVLDLQRDAVDPEGLLYSCDIDSLIWITKEPKFLGSVAVYAWPMIRNKAPIWKNNHIAVELLLPQSEEDRERDGPRSEWWTRRKSLSTIPHISFGTLGQGASAVDILMFFPRMTHQHPHLRFWQNQVPKLIQDGLWDNVILPSIRSVMPETAAIYIPVDRDHSKFKQGRGKEGSKTSLFGLEADKFTRLIKVMKDTVRILYFVFYCSR
jgi:hypothetical protein